MPYDKKKRGRHRSRARQVRPRKPSSADGWRDRSYCGFDREGGGAAASGCPSCAVAGNKLQIASPHTHEGGFEMHLLDAFGTVSRAFAEESLLDLVNAVRSRGSKSPTEQEINAALAAVDGVRPRDETEAMLTVQMVATHRAALDVLARARHAEHVPIANDCGNLAVKLLRTYTMQ